MIFQMTLKNNVTVAFLFKQCKSIITHLIWDFFYKTEKKD